MFNKGKSTVVGTITGLEPETVYDCYVITNDKKCGKPFRVETEPSLLFGGSLWSCDISESVTQIIDGFFPGGLEECFEIPITAGTPPVDVTPLSIVTGDGKVTFTYNDLVDFEVYGVQTCTLTQGGTQVTDCMEVLDQDNQENINDPSQVAGLEILGTKAYITRPFAGDVLICNIDKNGVFTDCDTTGPEEQGFINLHASGDRMYLSGDGVTVCSIEANGKLSGCKEAFEMENENEVIEPEVQVEQLPISMQALVGPLPTPLLFDTAIQGNNAYVSRPFTNTVYLCSIKSDGTFTGCEPTGLQDDFYIPGDVLIRGSTAYVASVIGQTITICSILENGGLANCNKNESPSFFTTALAV